MTTQTSSKRPSGNAFSSRLERLLARLMRRRHPGQALPLGALGVFIMVLAIIATMNLSQAVYQKIRLQNSADAAAYSLAAMEARAFNFVALTNRTQIVHYNAAMALQSYLTHAGFCVALWGNLRDLVNGVKSIDDVCSSWGYPIGVLCQLGARLAQATASIWGVIVTVLKKIHELVLDHKVWGIPALVEALTLFNKYAVWQMQFVRLILINSHLLSGMYEFVRSNDPQMGITAERNWINILINAVLNSLEFRAVFDVGAGLNPYLLDLAFGIQNIRKYKTDPDDDKVKDAMGVMSELVNASRSHKDIYNRSDIFFSVGPGAVLALIFGNKMGQTKLIEKGSVGPEVSEIRSDPINYPVGDTLASDDYLSSGMGFFMAPPGIGGVILTRANRIGDGIYANCKNNQCTKGGEHYLYKNQSSSSPAAPGGMASIGYFPTAPTGVQDNTETADGDHKFRPSPYFKFKPSGEREKDYNQPSTWVFLNKHHANFQTGNNKRPWHYNFNFTHGSLPTASLDTTIGGKDNSYLLEGLNVVSRGMVYYHRPGCWNEHPNFFNPFWRARLAPVGAKLMNIWDKYVSSNMTTSSENQVIRGLVNIARNLIGEFFFRTVTAVMTH